jgi:uncharacterized protein
MVPADRDRAAGDRPATLGPPALAGARGPWDDAAMAAADDRRPLAHIDRDECLRLLAGRSVGRLAVVEGGHPIVFPVNYVVTSDEVVFRTDAGAKLLAASRSPVAFQVDEIDEGSHRGWSVLVQGRAEEITDFDPSTVRSLREIPLHPWAAGEKSHWVRIVMSSVSGRRI